MYSLVSLLLLYYFVVVVWMFGVPHNVIFHPHHQTSPSSSAWLCKRFVCCAPNPVVMSIYYISLSVSECVSIYYMSVCNGICGEACSVRGHLLLNMHHRLKKKSGAHYSWCCEQRVSKFARIAYVQSHQQHQQPWQGPMTIPTYSWFMHEHCVLRSLMYGTIQLFNFYAKRT